MRQRIDKLFSQLGLLSRSECKKAIKKGRITINGIRAEGGDQKIEPADDIVCLDGQQVGTEEHVYYLMNKPAGVITARKDRTDPVVFTYIHDPRPDLAAVGRLDKDTTGILLFTNDGELNHRLLSSKYHVTKTYQVKIDGHLTGEDVRSLEAGLDIGDEKPTLPAWVKVVEEPDSYVELTITEGRYHQVKRMFAALGKPVLALHRSSFGPLSLPSELKPGEYRELMRAEVEALKEAANMTNHTL